jgi:hypothetical protein
MTNLLLSKQRKGLVINIFGLLLGIYPKPHTTVQSPTNTVYPFVARFNKVLISVQRKGYTKM